MASCVPAARRVASAALQRLCRRTPSARSAPGRWGRQTLPSQGLGDADKARSAGGLSIEWGLPFESSGPVTPVTLLSGFLGAGKTTLLRQLLENRSGLRVGVLVNDVAAVNVDSRLVSSQLVGAEGVELAELQNGCVCCSLADDLFASVSQLLSRSSSLDHIIVELSGVGEPGAVRQNWRMARELGHPAAMRSDIARVVTVVDTSCFSADWFEGRKQEEQQGALAVFSVAPLVDLMAQQIETADKVLLNKTDLAEAPRLQQARAVVEGLNPRAEVLEATFSAADLTWVLPQGRQTVPEEHHGHQEHGHEGHGHGQSQLQGGHDEHGHDHSHAQPHEGHSHDNDHGHSHAHGDNASPQQRYGVYSFVYEARRPFSAARLQALEAQFCETPRTLEAALGGLLRAKGVCWLDSAPLHEHSWSFAGSRCTLQRCDPWWAACSSQHLEWRCAYPGVQEVYERVRREAWQEEWGDRRQELVFIGGRGMEEAALRKQLDACLLQDEEFATFREANLSRVAPMEMSLGPGASLRA